MAGTPFPLTEAWLREDGSEQRRVGFVADHLANPPLNSPAHFPQWRVNLYRLVVWALYRGYYT